MTSGSRSLSIRSRLIGDVNFGEVESVEAQKIGDRFVIVVKVGGVRSPHWFGFRDESGQQKLFRDLLRQNGAANISDFELLKVIGQGTYGKVFLCRLKSTGQTYAMKSMSKRLLVEMDMADSTFLERAVLLQIRHPFIVAAHWAFTTPHEVHIVMDEVRGGNLLDRIRAHMTLDAVRLYAAEIGLALEYLHTNNAMHRDLKPENVLIDGDGHVQLADFGSLKLQSVGTTFCGTPYYISPEMLRGEPHSFGTDWWSYGILLYEMVVGQPPYFGPPDQESIMRVYRGIASSEPVYLGHPAVSKNPLFKDLLARILDKEQSTRLGHDGDFEAIRAHPFFAGIDWNALFYRKVAMPWKPPPRKEIRYTTVIQAADGQSFADPGTRAFEGFTMQENPTDR
jgi:serine/threonine protein kinase